MLSCTSVHLVQYLLLYRLAVALQVSGNRPIWRYQGLNLGVGLSTAGLQPSSSIKSASTLYTAQLSLANFPSKHLTWSNPLQ